MAKFTHSVGGFAAQNSGEIDNCFSIVKIKAKKSALGGFAGENIGGISHSFYSSGIRGLLGGVSGVGRGKTESSYFFHNENEKSNNLKKLRDLAAGVKCDGMKSKEDAEELGFNLEDIWEYIGGSQVLRFVPDKWMFDITQSPLYPRYLKEAVSERKSEDKDDLAVEPVRQINSGERGTVSVMERIMPLEKLSVETQSALVPVKEAEATVIRTASELFELAKAINEGDRDLRTAYIRLENDIDLGGKEWTPIGSDLAKAFSGLFDGCGHMIKNFVIKSKNTKAKGFFGYLKGEVYNLTVDCRIKGGTMTGGIAAYCEQGIIGYCASIIEIKHKNKEGSCGGLAGSNTGRIFQSYSAGKITPAIITLWPFLPLPLLLFLLPLFIVLPKTSDSLPVYAPVPFDPGIARVPGVTVEPRTGTNFVSFQFERTVDVNLSTGECVFNFVNPGNSNHDIVVQLQFLDSQAMEIMGSTGRTQEEQEMLDNNPNYIPDNHRVVIAESGSIPPGYRLSNLRLVEQPNGAVIPPGEYSAIAFLIFYDINTHNRAMLESQMPIVITVHN